MRLEDKLTSQIAHPIKKSIKSRVILQVSIVIAFAIVAMAAMATLVASKHMNNQMHSLLSNNAHAVQHRIEERLRYLVENTLLLAKNEFVVNALIDVTKRGTYLNPLVQNFMEGKEVLSLSVVDFDGIAIYKSIEQLPRYETSAALRASLALGNEVMFLDETGKNIMLIVPVRYYATTQGAMVALFDLEAIAGKLLPNDSNMFVKLHKGATLLHSFRFDEQVSYTTYRLQPLEETPWIGRVGLELEVGAQSDEFFAPLRQTLYRLIILAVVFVFVGIVVAVVLANKITRPILELYKRVKNSDGSENTLCSPIGTDDEIDALAKVFDEHSLMLQYQARHDALTSLPNRLLFIDRLEQAIAASKQDRSMVAVLFLDLDHFKEINDSFGHSVGDTLLQNVAQKLSENIRKSDTVARLGGDEFTVLLPSIRDENQVIDTVNTIVENFKEIHAIEEHKFYISCSIGIALYPQDGTVSEEILRNADAAMYQAKELGRNTYEFYTKDMTEKAYRRITLETQLRHAIENEELMVYLQPQVDMITRTIVGMEALVRWIKEDGTMVSPVEFIPLAEDTRLIVPLDRLIMKKAIASFAAWKKEGLEPGVLSLNLSMIQLETKDFIAYAVDVLRQNELDTQSVMFEITETQMMKNPEQMIRILGEIKQLGFGIAIDDFGTGQSSLSYLRQFPVNKIKIDQSFVRDIPNEKEDMELTRAIIAIAQSLNYSVIAEGVETQEQADFLQLHKCFEAQGYLYHRPMPLAQVEEMLKTKKLEKILGDEG